MSTLRIEHAISDFDTWKAAFDRDPANRKESGVRRYSIHRPLDDPHYILLDLDFDDPASAEAMIARLQAVWTSAAAAPALAGRPVTRILDPVEVANL